MNAVCNGETGQLSAPRSDTEKAALLNLIEQTKAVTCDTAKSATQYYVALGFSEERENLATLGAAISDLRRLNAIEKAVRENLRLSNKQGRYLNAMRKRLARRSRLD